MQFQKLTSNFRSTNHCSNKNEKNAKDDFRKKLNMLQEGYIPWS